MAPFEPFHGPTAADPRRTRLLVDVHIDTDGQGMQGEILFPGSDPEQQTASAGYDPEGPDGDCSDDRPTYFAAISWASSETLWFQTWEGAARAFLDACAARTVVAAAALEAAAAGDGTDIS